MSHPESYGKVGECFPFPALYEEQKFIPTINREMYLFRQAGSAVYLCSMYRKWIRALETGVDGGRGFYWRLALVGPLLHLIRVHELQGVADVTGKVEAVSRSSFYIQKMWEMTRCTQDNHGLRLAIQGVMYLRGLARYRQLVAANFGHPYTIWIRDAELNARLCLDVLEDMGSRWTAGDMIQEAVKADEQVMMKVEARK